MADIWHMPWHLTLVICLWHLAYDTWTLTLFDTCHTTFYILKSSFRSYIFQQVSLSWFLEKVQLTFLEKDLPPFLKGFTIMVHWKGWIELFGEGLSMLWLWERCWGLNTPQKFWGIFEYHFDLFQVLIFWSLIEIGSYAFFIPIQLEGQEF